MHLNTIRVPVQSHLQNVDEDLVYQKVAELGAVLIATETEWDRDKLQLRLYEYLKKAARRTEDSKDLFADVVEEVAGKFYDSCYNGCGDRQWLVTTDFSLCIVFAIKAWRKECLMQAALPTDTEKVVYRACKFMQDSARYHANSWQTIKNTIKQCVPKKEKQQMIEDAISNTREKLVRQVIGQEFPADTFILTWAQSFLEEVAKESNQKNPKCHLSEADASKLFNEIIQTGNGLPMWMDLLKPDAGSTVVSDAITFAYSTYPEPEEPKGKGKKGKDWSKDGGKGKEKDGGKGKGFDMPGFDMDSVMNMVTQMANMMSKGMDNGGWKGDGWKGGGGGWGGDGWKGDGWKGDGWKGDGKGEKGKSWDGGKGYKGDDSYDYGGGKDGKGKDKGGKPY